jgi:regulator of protease activity HflC (stomatin/prohibitin superfamily)
MLPVEPEEIDITSIQIEQKDEIQQRLADLFLVMFSLVLIFLGLRIVQQYEKGVVFRFGKIVSVRGPGLNLIIPFTLSSGVL